MIYPRTVPQADALNRFFSRRGQTLHHVIGLEVPEEELVDRMIKRGRRPYFSISFSLWVPFPLPGAPKITTFISKGKGRGDSRRIPPHGSTG